MPSRSAGSQSDWFLLGDHRPVFCRSRGFLHDLFSIIFLMIFPIAFKPIFDPKMVPKWTPNGPQNRPKIEVARHRQRGSKNRSILDSFLVRFCIDFLIIFGSIFEVLGFALSIDHAKGNFTEIQDNSWLFTKHCIIT